MSTTELAARVLILRHLRHGKMPRLMRDGAVAVLQSRLQHGLLPCRTDGMRSAFADRAALASPALDPTRGGADGTVVPPGHGVCALSDAALIDRFKVVCALEQALRVPDAVVGVQAVIATAVRHNDAEMLDIVDEWVRRIAQRGPPALR
jgi:hypothetical protein